MIEIRCRIKRLKEALRFEKQVNPEEHKRLSSILRRKRDIAKENNETVVIFDDFAKHSFGFTVYRSARPAYNGGIICHNLPNNNPFTVTLDPDTNVHWSVHT